MELWLVGLALLLLVLIAGTTHVVLRGLAAYRAFRAAGGATTDALDHLAVSLERLETSAERAAGAGERAAEATARASDSLARLRLLRQALGHAREQLVSVAGISYPKK